MIVILERLTISIKPVSFYLPLMRLPAKRLMLPHWHSPTCVAPLDSTTWEVEDGGGWQQVTRRRRRQIGCTIRASRKGGKGMQEGDGDSATAATKQITGSDDGADEARRQRTWENYCNDGATAPLQALAG